MDVDILGESLNKAQLEFICEVNDTIQLSGVHAPSRRGSFREQMQFALRVAATGFEMSCLVTLHLDIVGADISRGTHGTNGLGPSPSGSCFPESRSGQASSGQMFSRRSILLKNECAHGLGDAGGVGWARTLRHSCGKHACGVACVGRSSQHALARMRSCAA